MKRILNIIGIFFLSIIVFTGCQNFTEDEMEMSPQTRAQLSSGTHYYWYKGNKIPITINTTKSYILFESSDEANLQLPLLNSKSGLSAAKVTLSSRLQLQDATRSAANDNLYWAEVATADVNAQDKALVYSAPYFKTSDGADLGLSHLFYVKVKSIRDVRILTTLATENKVTLLGNNEYLPLWYTLSCTNESLGNALEMANKTSEEVFSLLDNLLKWTKSQLGKLSNVPQPIDLVGLVDGVIEVFKPIAESKSIALALERSIESVEVVVDVEMIKSVVRNLISNAIKFSHKDTTVTTRVETRMDERNGLNEVIVIVSDKGCGIKEEDQPKLLNEATHFTTFGTNSEEGSGLGLLLCKDFVAKNNGQLWFTSKPGAGSDFCFSLPLK